LLITLRFSPASISSASILSVRRGRRPSTSLTLERRRSRGMASSTPSKTSTSARLLRISRASSNSCLVTNTLGLLKGHHLGIGGSIK
jgi:hypothetical protein